MSGIKPITFYFKVKSKDELEVEELLHTQSSRHSKTSSLEFSRTISTVSAEVMSIITLVDLTTNNDSNSAGGLTTLLPVYHSDVYDDDDFVNVDLTENDVGNSAFSALDTLIGPSSSIGNSVFSALDTFIGPSSSLVSLTNNQPHGREISKRIKHRRPDNWRQIADYYKIYRNIAATIKLFDLNSYSVVDVHDKRHIYALGYYNTSLDKRSRFYERDCAI